jgi:hypothetical protein
MAKIKVMMTFIDVHTLNRHPEGEVFEATPERIAEIQSVNPDLIQVIPEEDPVVVPKKKRKKVGEE